MIKAIIFDFWGTLVENGVWSPIKQVKDILGLRMPFSEYVVRMEKAMMTKEFPTLKETFEAVCDEFAVEPSEERLERLIGMWNKSWMLAKPYDEVAEELQRLKGKYKLILVSNTDSFSVNKVIEKFRLKELFDEIFFSYQVGLIKTDQEFFSGVLEKTNLDPESCMVVGDSIQSDMKAAENAGIKGILIDRKDKREFQPKIKNLKELDAFLE